MSPQKISPIHPGEVLMEDFLKPYGFSQYRVAKDISVSARRINEIVHGKCSITVNTVLRLAKYFNTTAQLWLNLQSNYNLCVEEDLLAGQLEKEVKVLQIPT